MGYQGENRGKQQPNMIVRTLIVILCALITAGALTTVLVVILRQQRGVRTESATVTENMPENASAQTVKPAEPSADEKQDARTVREITCVGDFSDEKWSEGIVGYRGKQYQYKSGLQNYLFLGIDNDDVVKPAEDGISGGQSDAIFLVVTDRSRQEISVIAINRNTMVPVDVYDRDGNYLVQMDLQICLQHGYGDGMKLSCIRSVDAVNRLFKGIPISGYLSLNMGGLAALNDAIGGVELTPIESIKRGDVVITKGKPVTLNGEQAYAYLRTRDVDEFASANNRLLRQQQYIVAVMEKLLADPGKATRIYEDGSDYIVASIDLPKLVKDAKDMTFTEERMYSLTGETEFKDDFEQFHADEDALIQLILDVFYEELPSDEVR